MADVTKTEFDALAKRVQQLEQVPQLTVSAETDNAIHTAGDGGIFVAKGPTQADLDKLAQELQDLVEINTVTATELHALSTAQAKTETDLHDLAAAHQKTAAAVSQAATSVQVTQLEKQLQELAVEYKKVATAAVTLTPGDGIKLEPTS